MSISKASDFTLAFEHLDGVEMPQILYRLVSTRDRLEIVNFFAGKNDVDEYIKHINSVGGRIISVGKYSLESIEQ